MTLVQVLKIMQEYSLKVLLLALIVCALTSVLKIWIFKSNKKFLTFVPFVLGIAVYCVYALIAEGAKNILTINTVFAGLECGAAATIYYIIYEQFIRGKKVVSVSSKEVLAVMGILKNCVKEDILEEVSDKIATILIEKTMSETEMAVVFAEIIKGNAVSEISEIELLAMIALITKL